MMVSHRSNITMAYFRAGKEARWVSAINPAVTRVETYKTQIVFSNGKGCFYC